jgi:FG-GAP repeat
MGNSISSAGDVNGDGIADVLVGAVGGDRADQSSAGESYVVFGRPTGFPTAFQLRSLLPAAGGDGSAGFVLKGVDAFDYAGVSVSGAGDVNGDGFDDMIVSAFRADPHGRTNGGESYVVFGRGSAFPPVIELRSLFPGLGGDGSTGFAIAGVEYSDESGRSVSAAGDVNGDGIDDLVIGASGAGPGFYSTGQAYVVFGRSSGFPAAFDLRRLLPARGGDGSEGFIIQGIENFDRVGISVSGAGDVNGDGIDDLIIGAYFRRRLADHRLRSAPHTGRRASMPR